MVERALFATTIALLNSGHADHRFAAGLNPYGKEWSHIAKTLQEECVKFFAADVRRLDKTIPLDILSSFTLFVFRLQELCSSYFDVDTLKYPDGVRDSRYRTMCSLVCEAQDSPVCVAEDFVFYFPNGMHCSGIFLTVAKGSYATLHAMMQAWLYEHGIEDIASSVQAALATSAGNHFLRLFKTKHGGDDIVGGVVSEEAVGTLSPVSLDSLFEVARRRLGMEYTAAHDKHQKVEFKDSIEDEAIQFWSRNFVKYKGEFMGPLKESSIGRPYNWRSKDQPDDAAFRSFWLSFIYEAIQYPDEYIQDISRRMEEAGLFNKYGMKPPPMSEAMIEFYRQYSKGGLDAYLIGDEKKEIFLRMRGDHKDWTRGCGEVMEAQSGMAETRQMLVNEAAQATAQPGLLGTAANAAAGVAAGVSTVASGVSGVLSSGASLLGSFGLSRPAMGINAHSYETNPYHGMQSVDAQSGQSLGAFSKNAIGPSPAPFGSAVNTDTIETIAQRAPIVHTVPITSDMLPGTVVHRHDCSITAANVTESGGLLTIQSPPQGILAQSFSYWRCDSIKFKFRIVCNAFVRGKLIIFFDPRSAGKSSFSDSDYTRGQWTRHDIADGMCFDIEIPFTAPTPWLEVGPFASGYNPRFSLGTLMVGIFNRISAPGDATDEFDMFIRASYTGLQFAMPTLHHVQHISPKPTVSINSLHIASPGPTNMSAWDPREMSVALYDLQRLESSYLFIGLTPEMADRIKNALEEMTGESLDHKIIASNDLVLAAGQCGMQYVDGGTYLEGSFGQAMALVKASSARRSQQTVSRVIQDRFIAQAGLAEDLVPVNNTTMMESTIFGEVASVAPEDAVAVCHGDGAFAGDFRISSLAKRQAFFGRPVNPYGPVTIPSFGSETTMTFTVPGIPTVYNTDQGIWTFASWLGMLFRYRRGGTDVTFINSSDSFQGRKNMRWSSTGYTDSVVTGHSYAVLRKLGTASTKSNILNWTMVSDDGTEVHKTGLLCNNFRVNNNRFAPQVSVSAPYYSTFGMVGIPNVLNPQVTNNSVPVIDFVCIMSVPSMTTARDDAGGSRPFPGNSPNTTRPLVDIYMGLKDDGEFSYPIGVPELQISKVINDQLIHSYAAPAYGDVSTASSASLWQAQSGEAEEPPPAGDEAVPLEADGGTSHVTKESAVVTATVQDVVSRMPSIYQRMSAPDDGSQYMPRLLGRPIKLAALNLDGNEARGDILARVSAPGDWLTNDYIAPRINNYTYLTVDGFIVRAVMSASPFVYGALQIVGANGSQLSPTNSNENIYSLSAFPNVLLVAGSSDNTAVALHVPFISPHLKLEITQGGVCDMFGQVLVQVLSPIRSTNGAEKKISIQLTMEMINPQLHQPTLSDTAPYSYDETERRGAGV
jgi:hypothetical protein